MGCSDDLKGKRILLVDDEPDILATLEDLLDDCTTTRAASYAEARRQIETEPIDIAILDIMGVDGYALLKQCVEKGITAVMLTARAQTPADIARSFRGGAAYFIPKEEMARLETFLGDILDAQRKGRSTWTGWYNRLAAFGERTFGPDLAPEDEDFLDQLIKY